MGQTIEETFGQNPIQLAEVMCNQEILKILLEISLTYQRNN